MPGKVPQPHNQKKKGKSIQERRAEKRLKKAGSGAAGIRLPSGSERSGTTHGGSGH